MNIDESNAFIIDYLFVCSFINDDCIDLYIMFRNDTVLSTFNESKNS